MKMPIKGDEYIKEKTLLIRNPLSEWNSERFGRMLTEV